MNNFVQDGKHLPVVCSDPATPASGDPVRFGTMTGVALSAEGEGGVSASTETMVKFDGGVYKLSVKGIDDSAGSAVSVGDSIFYVDADTPKLSKKSSGYFFGIAMATITSGATATIEVRHISSPGSGTLGSGTVGTTNLAAGAVTAAKLGTTLATGCIQLPISDALIIATNDIATVGTAQVAKDTDPILERGNAATDKQLRLSWASASVLEVQLPSICYPPDLDDTAAIEVHVLAKMKAASVDTPVIAVGAFEGTGDTNFGGNTGALSTTLQDLTVTLAAGGVGPYPTTLAITLTPGAHATGSNDVYVYGAWIEYARK